MNLGETVSPGTPFQRQLGLRWDTADHGSAIRVTMDLRADLCGPAGSVEGGVVSTLADVAGASACAVALGGKLVATEHMAVSFLAPGRVGPIEAAGKVLRLGERDAVAEVRVVDSGRDRRLMAVALVTVRSLDDRAPHASGRT